MAHLGAAGPFVQIVDILGDQEHIAGELTLQPGQRQVGGVGLYPGQPGAATVVETVDQRRIAPEGFGGCQVHGVVLLPQAIRVAKGGHSGLRRDAGTGQHHQALYETAVKHRHGVAPARPGPALAGGVDGPGR